MRRVRLPLLAALVVAAGSVAAQDLGGALDLGQLGASLGVADGIQRQLGGHHAGRPAIRRRPANARHPETPDLSAATARRHLFYRLDPALGQRLLDRYVARVASSDPATAARLRDIFARTPPLTVGTRWLGRYGMTPRNAADAAAAYLSTAWLISRGDNGDPSRAQITGLRDQLAQALAATPGFVRAGDAVKQEFAHTMLVQAMVDGAIMSGAARDPARTRAVADTTVSAVKASFGLDLRALRLTARGFEPT